MSHSNGRIEKRVWIKASPDVVYRALTNARELLHWFCDRASCDLREGGELVAYWKAGKSSQKGRAVFTNIVPGAALKLLWIDDGQGVKTGNAGHVLSYDIRSKAGITEVAMLDEDDLIPDQESYAILDQGWNSVLLELKDYCERKERSAKARPRPIPHPRSVSKG